MKAKFTAAIVKSVEREDNSSGISNLRIGEATFPITIANVRHGDTPFKANG